MRYKGKSKLDLFKETIDQWLMDDKKARKKQRHTAKRVYERLVTLHKEGFSPLEHIAGEAQVDFGSADFYEKGYLHSGHYLNMSFPNSNQGYSQLSKGENQECLFQGMMNIFYYMGGVPERIWLDNARP